MKKYLDDLIKKVHSLKDLREAIKVVKSNNLEKAAVLPFPGKSPAPAPQPPKEAQRQEAKSTLQHTSPDLRHLGIDDTHPGFISHMVGIPKSNQHYRINYDKNKASQGHAPFTLHLQDESGRIKVIHPTPHKDIGSAVKALVNHSFKGKWE